MKLNEGKTITKMLYNWWLFKDRLLHENKTTV